MSGAVKFGRTGTFARRNERERLLFVGSALIACSLAVVALVVLNHRSEASAREVQQSVAAPVTMGYTTLYFPERDIPAGTKLSDVNFREMYWPKSEVPEGAVRDRAELRAMFAKSAISAGTPVIKDYITDQPIRTALSLSKGYRAVAIEVDATGVIEGWATPGNRVDVVLTYMKDEELTSKVIVENVRVLSLGGSDKSFDERRSEVLEQAVAPSSTITLEVLPQDALKIQTARQLGRLSLLMRATGEEKTMGMDEFSAGDFEGSQRKTNARQGGCVSRGTIRVEGEEYLIDCTGNLSRVVAPE